MILARKIFFSLLLVAISACTTTSVVRLTKEANPAIIYFSWDRQSIATWSGAEVIKIDGELIGATPESTLHVAPGKHNLAIRVRFNRGLGAGGPAIAEKDFLAELKPATEYKISYSIDESKVSIWLSDPKTGQRIGDVVTTVWSREQKEPASNQAAAKSKRIMISKQMPDFLVASMFQNRSSAKQTSQTAILVANKLARDRIDTIKKENTNNQPPTDQEEIDAPREIDGYFSSIKDITNKENPEFGLVKCSGINCRFSTYLEVHPGIYNINYICKGGGGIAHMSRTAYLSPGKKYHFVCTQPSRLRDVARLSIIESASIDADALSSYYSTFKFEQ